MPRIRTSRFKTYYIYPTENSNLQPTFTKIWWKNILSKFFLQVYPVTDVPVLTG